jgi:hypothetical protein
MFLYELYVTVCYTNGCLCSNVTPDDGHDERPKHVEFLEIKAKLQLRLVGYIYTYCNTMHGTMNLKKINRILFIVQTRF